VDPAKAEPAKDPAVAEPAAVAPQADRIALLPDIHNLEQANQQLHAIEQARGVLEKRFDDGEIDAKQLNREMAKLSRYENNIDIAIAQSKFTAAANVQTVQSTWEGLHRDYRSKHPELVENKALEEEWDYAVKTLAQNKKNEDKPMSWFLEEGHRRACAVLGTAAPAASTKATPAKQATPEDRKSAEAPQTLMSTPAATPSETGQGEFAHIDQLSGVAQERAHAKLSPEQYDRYLKGA
jgi:hypothetical protein